LNLKELFRRMRKSNFFIAGAVIVLAIIVLALIAPKIIVFDPIKADLIQRLKAPEYLSKGWSGHIFGTDPLGQDVLTRLLIGSRMSLFISVTVVVGTAILGTILGVVSGFYGKAIDNVIMRIADIQMSIPPIILAIAVMAVLGNSIRNLIAVLIITRWTQYTRVVRSSVLIMRNVEFIQASRALGSSNLRIMFTQVLPNVLTALIILMSQQFGATILTEASMSFLGLGVPAPTPSWGAMISEGREYLVTSPWVVVAPGCALMIAVLGFNFLGDGVRDILDPKTKH
jgi:ABC-type dipeptide/oligopeptide/nickel transport system permease subunit